MRDLQTLDWVVYLGLAPERFAKYSGLEQYFALARGTDEVQLALDMSKYFDTNYRALPLPARLDPSPRSTESQVVAFALDSAQACLTFCPYRKLIELG